MPSCHSPLRRRTLAAGLALACAGVAGAGIPAAKPPKVLRYALDTAETGFDPATVPDIYSRELLDNVFEAPLRFDLLARPPRLRTSTAVALPEMSADFRELTLHIRPGIVFADDPVFHGKVRELTAADYAYALRRHFDPHVRSAGYAELATDDILGLQALRDRASAKNTPFDYDAPVEGLQCPDRYTLRLRFGHPAPRFPLRLAQTLYAGAVAREVVEAYGEAITEHPVGTGPYRLAQWRRASLIVMERNPRYRDEVFDEQPAPDDADGQAILRRLHGRRLPMVDRVEVSIIEESQPAWLAYLRGDFDLAKLRADFVNFAAPGGRLAPNLARRGMQLRLLARPDVVYTYFNMDDPVVGGYTPDKVALRRAIGLAYDNAEEIRLLRKRLALPAQGFVVPLVPGYDPAYRSAMSDYSPERARALLDLFGYVDHDGDGWREQPDGSPLALRITTPSDSSSRQLNELWQKRMDAIGVHIAFDRGLWPAQMQQARGGKLQMWLLSDAAGGPDAADVLGIGYGPYRGESNFARFDLPAYNDDYRQILQLPDGAARDAVVADAEKLLLAYMPYKAHVHHVTPIVTQPWVIGWPANPFVYGWWRYLDIDTAKLQARE